MNDVICIDGGFSSKQLQFWALHGVKYPEQEKMYSIREVVKHTNGETGILLEEIVNPLVPVKHLILGVINREPTFNLKRFRTLDGKQISKEMLQEFFRITQNKKISANENN